MCERAEYITVKGEGNGLYTEKKSRFIADVFPVQSEEDALSKLAAVKKKYPDARHHVYAYIIGKNNIFRYSDDSEPSGTAGMPVLDTMRKSGIVDTLIVVTRYFGGTLLGTGGLVHAYSAAAKQGLENAQVVKRILCNVLSVSTDYTFSGKIAHLAEQNGYIIEDTIYADNVTIVFLTTLEETQRIIKELTELTAAKAEITVTGQKYVDLPTNKTGGN